MSSITRRGSARMTSSLVSLTSSSARGLGQQFLPDRPFLTLLTAKNADAAAGSLCQWPAMGQIVCPALRMDHCLSRH
jgi:hypothetical protein